MKKLSPRLRMRRFELTFDPRQTVDYLVLASNEDLVACCEELRKVLEFPDDAKAYWLEISDKPSEDAVKFQWVGGTFIRIGNRRCDLVTTDRLYMLIRNNNLVRDKPYYFKLLYQ